MLAWTASEATLRARESMPAWTLHITDKLLNEEEAACEQAASSGEGYVNPSSQWYRQCPVQSVSENRGKRSRPGYRPEEQ
ncbi:hypothetical protein KSB_55230 [Ktedonobacter robiniae]|uniref:Uncharacterized protein n=1 Tax=Ktedonobacter robiniae TaxID=2778365 RepID=A0ABQ3UWK0_9CHLR|nr:hypothetical protein KSB_55230 [Ktedonobacter robiniae]